MSFKALPYRALVALCLMVERRADYLASNIDQSHIISSNSTARAGRISRVVLLHLNDGDSGDSSSINIIKKKYYSDWDLDSPGKDVDLDTLQSYLESFTRIK